jgi:hypothetical protein
MYHKLKKFDECFKAMALTLTERGIISYRGDYVVLFDPYGGFETKDEGLVEMIEEFLKMPADFTFKKAEPKKETPKKRKRARKKDGTYQADDPSTPDVNEAWIEE